MKTLFLARLMRRKTWYRRGTTHGCDVVWKWIAGGIRGSRCLGYVDEQGLDVMKLLSSSLLFFVMMLDLWSLLSLLAYGVYLEIVDRVAISNVVEHVGASNVDTVCPVVSLLHFSISFFLLFIHLSLLPLFKRAHIQPSPAASPACQVIKASSNRAIVTALCTKHRNKANTKTSRLLAVSSSFQSLQAPRIPLSWTKPADFLSSSALSPSQHWKSIVHLRVSVKMGLYCKHGSSGTELSVLSALSPHLPYLHPSQT